jgi:hypothetical protein
MDAHLLALIDRQFPQLPNLPQTFGLQDAIVERASTGRRIPRRLSETARC